MPFNKQYLYEFAGGHVSHRDFDGAEGPDGGSAPWLLALMRKNYELHRPVVCRCRCLDGTHPLLDVCQLGDTLYLRRRKGSHGLHAYDCQHRDAPDNEGAGGDRDYVPGIRREQGGGYSIGLSTDLFPARAAERLGQAKRVASSGADTDNTAGDRRGRSTLLGLFQFLLDEIGVGYWKPEFKGCRDAITLSGEIDRIARRCRDTQGNPMVDFVLPFHRVTSGDHLLAAIDRSSGGSRRVRELILISPLAGLTRPRWAGAHAILKPGGRIPALWMAEEAWNAVERAYKPLLAETTTGEFVHRLWGAFTVRAPGLGQRPGVVYASTAAFIAMTEDFIPVQSQHEAAFANYLVSEGREFTKPLRYSHGDTRFPDFILHDTKPSETHIEVLGFTDEKYRNRIAEKEAGCRSEGLAFMTWDAVNEDPLPRLPRAERSPGLKLAGARN